MLRFKLALLSFMACLGTSSAFAGGTINIGILGEPGSLDPALTSSTADRLLMNWLCDRLIATDDAMRPVPGLTKSWDWSADGLALTLHLRPDVKFQDGTAFDADAVKLNLDRMKTLEGSVRKGELAPVASVDVVDPVTVAIKLKEPYLPLVSVLGDRAGMMMSAKAIKELGDKSAERPVCAGPFAFKERVAQDHITLQRFPGYWDAGSISIDEAIFRPMASSTTRLVNLRSGQIDIAEAIASTDAAAVRSDPKLRFAKSASAGYRYIIINVNSGPRSKSKLGQDARVRQALDKVIDRQALNQVVFDGLNVANNQIERANSTFWAPDYPVPPRDLEGAKKLLADAGATGISFSLQIPNGAEEKRVGEVVQSMAAEAGIKITLSPAERNAARQANTTGDFDATLQSWAGRTDPDSNMSVLLTCDAAYGWGRYCNPKLDELLAEGRKTSNEAKRKKLYQDVAAIYLKDAPVLVLYNYTWLWGLRDRVEGFTPNENGFVMPQGLKLKP